MKNYQNEIEEITKEREQLAQRLEQVLKQKEIRDHLMACNKDGHVWALTGVQSTVDEVTDLSITCTRCMGSVEELVANAEDVTLTIQWPDAERDEMLALLEDE